MKNFRGLLLAMVLMLAARSAFAVRTVVFMLKETVTGQDIFIKGGHDAGLVPSVYPSMSEPITYFNTKNTTTAAIKANDASLDWGTESALDWTCNAWPASWGTKRTYAVDGYGEDPENTMGLHWWKFDADMTGATGDWFEFKAFMRQGTTESWENNISQAGTPSATINHWGKKGYITKVYFGQGWVEFKALGPVANQPPVANAGGDITVIKGGTANFNASGSYDPDGSIVSYLWSNGLSGVSPTKVYSTLGDYTVTLTVKDNANATATDTVVVHVIDQPVSTGDFREETVYFIMTDRFADGNTANNTIWGGEYTSDIYNIWDTSKSGVLSYYHGGDFQGIINNLDYIQGLGFTAIWITPVVKQPEGRHFNGSDYSASPFHGYWGYDFDQIDPHLHNSGKANNGWADFDKLVAAVHNRGMKIMLDIVVNHGQPTVVSPSAPTYANRNTIKMDGQTWTWITGDPYYNAAQSPHTDGFFSYANGTWLIDLIDFNENGTYNARTHLKNVYKRFIDHGVDAFRIDTVAYMTAGFWKDFTDTMKSYAATKGKPNFYMCGEAWTGDRTAAVGLIYNNGLNKSFNMLDLHGSSMDFPGWMGKAFKNEAGFNDVNGWARISGTAGDASGKYDPTYLATFIDNHDVTRANGILNQTQYMNNLNYIYLFRGIPIVYYGTEILYSSWPNYITTTDKNDVVARWMLGSEGINYVKNNQPTLSRHIKMLNAIRKSSTALQKGTQIDISMTGDKAVFKRDAGTKVAFVGLSKGAGFSHTITGIPSGTYRVITPDTPNASYKVQTVSITSGSYAITVPANSFVILDK